MRGNSEIGDHSQKVWADVWAKNMAIVAFGKRSEACYSVPGGTHSTENNKE